jgi:hypothetical protein
MKLQLKRTTLARFGMVMVIGTLSGSVATGEALSSHETQTDLWQSLGLKTEYGETCFYKDEQVDGMNKICYYSCPSGDAAITVSSVSLCPLSIQR